jgi:signal transduction histidine kinase
MTEVDLMLANAEPDQRIGLQAIRENCVSMNGIIDTLLAAARTELVRTVGHAELGPVLKTFSSELRSPVVRAVDTDLSVGIDADLVTRILAPLVDNGRRFARTEVRLEAARDDAVVAIRIVNDGPPVAAELTETIFDPGFTASPDNGHVGAGLGLALARRLARAADGDLRVDPDAATTTFVLTLPAG